ncbi:hypothetical protein V5799_023498 [Amblyomma americanum]|uniref:M13 family peptidase n=1 Tax=Amblyomma americanum TaxID=6943 RepID=A0AAQ4FJ39_AMBAM
MFTDGRRFQATLPTLTPAATSVVPPLGRSLRWRLCVVCSGLGLVALAIGVSLAVNRIMSGTGGEVQPGGDRGGASPQQPLPGRGEVVSSCVDESCHQLARYVSDSLEEGDPCDNFYDYVCTNWSSSFRFQGEAVYSEAVRSARELESQLTALFDAGTEDTSTRPLFDLYDACLHLPTGRREALDFQNILDSVGLSGFPYSSSDRRASAAAGRLLRVTGVSPLVHIRLTDKSSVKLQAPRTLFPDFTYLPNAHRGWYNDAARRVARMSMPELFDLEQELVALLSAPAEQFGTVAVKELMSTTEWNWAEFLTNALFGIRIITPDTKVTLEQNRLGVVFLGLMSATKPAVVLNYLAFRLALAYAPLLPGKRFRKISDVAVSQVVGWEDGWSDRRSHTCAKMAAQAEPGLAAFLLAANSKQDEKEPVLRSMAEHAKRNMLEFLGEMSWVTSSFLSRVERRFKVLKTAFFTPGDWRKFAFRTSQCRSFGCASDGLTAVEIFLKMVAQRQHRRLGPRRHPFPDFPDDLFETEIRVLEGSTLFVPLGALDRAFRHEAFWEYHLPRMLLQLSAALLDVFRDVALELRSNYTDLHDRFAATEYCLREEQATMTETTSVPFSSNGTGRQDLRDLLAVSAAFRAHGRLVRSGGSEGTLPGLPFSSEQLFFLHMALSRCEKYDAPYEDQLLRHGRRAHAAYRVNAPLRQSVSFSRAFQCRRGSYMNPRRKCVF